MYIYARSAGDACGADWLRGEMTQVYARGGGEV